mgnify:CR=1 FL=1
MRHTLQFKIDTFSGCANSACFLCGKKTKNPQYIRIDSATWEAITEDEIINPVNDLGLQVVGSECAKQIPKQFIIKK